MTKVTVLVVVVLVGATAAAGERRAPAEPKEREFTLGMVQRDVRMGMSQADLAEAIGSPNVVTRDAKGGEAWVYDRLATEARYSSAEFGVGGGGSHAGAPPPLLGWLSAHKRSDKASVSQRTPTVVVRFD